MSAGKRWLCAGLLGSLAGGCSQLVGFEDVRLDEGPGDAGGDAPTGDAPTGDTPMEPPPDGPAPKLWVFVTNAGFTGGFGVPNGARVTADIKCDDMLQAVYAGLGCTQVHAVIQIDDTVDSLARMDINFPIPQSAEVLRAMDATPVASSWDALVDPNATLLAPVNTAGSVVPFWSGRGVTSNLQCTNWTSASGSQLGNMGDASRVNGWMSQANVPCNNFNQRLLCVCW